MNSDITVITVDEGTSSIKTTAWKSGVPLASHREKIGTSYTSPGFVEQDPLEILEKTKVSINLVSEKIGLECKNLGGISLANQRESIVCWDKISGNPLYPSINWQDSRSKGILSEMESDYYKIIKSKTGLIPSPYFSAPKIKWLLRNNDKIQLKAKKNEVMFGTIDSWLIWNMTHNFATDYTNASRTLLFDIKEMDWDSDLLELFEIKREWLPDPFPSVHFYGNANFGAVDVPVLSVIGDQQASMVGHGVFKEGDTKITYGTGSFLLTNAGDRPVNSERILETIAYSLEEKRSVYAYEGSILAAGNTIDFLKRLKIVKNDREIDRETRKIRIDEDIYFVPAFSGLGAPYWSNEAAPVMVGFKNTTERYQFIPALMRSIAFQVYDIISEIEKSTGLKLTTISADGGLSQNDYLMQFQADILGKNVIRKKFHEMTSYGSYILSAIALKNLIEKDIKKVHDSNEIFVPNIDDTHRRDLLIKWKRAIEMSLKWKNI
ncbi:MAG: FGGY-family carbohydrate kinase [Thermoplasmata archaeon]